MPCVTKSYARLLIWIISRVRFAALATVNQRKQAPRGQTAGNGRSVKKLAKVKVSVCSKAIQQPIALAQAFVNITDLVMLEEPTDVLEPLGRRVVRERLSQTAANPGPLFAFSPFRLFVFLRFYR